MSQIKFKAYDWKVSYQTIKKLANPQETLMLDIGCGNGEKTAIHKELVNMIVGLDIELKALKEARKRNILTVQADVLKITIQRQSISSNNKLPRNRTHQKKASTCTYK